MKKHVLISLLSVLGVTAGIVGQAHASEVVGNLSGEFTVNSGNLSYTLPIVTPEGIHKMRPNISVNYSNSVGAGLLGAGFTLSASSSISRCNPNVDVDGFKAGIELNSNARFCIDGQKLVAINGQDGDVDTEYRNVQDNNVRYFSRGGSNNTPVYWEMHSPEGFKYKYEKVSSNNSRFSAWFLTEKSDFFGNAIDYSYSSGVMPTIEQISYSGYTIDFNFENREQPIGQYRDGEYYELSKRLSSIVLSRNNIEINRYRFLYETIVPNDNQAPLEPLEKLKRLSQVEKCYGPNGQDGCLKPLTFNYQEQPDPTLGLDNPEDRTIVVPRSYYASSATEQDGFDLYKRPSYAAADMNNDGLSDFCYYQHGSGIMCATSTSSGSYNAPVAWTADLGYVPIEEEYGYYSQLQLIDLNADTLTDVCLADATGLRCALNTGGTGFGSVSYWSTALNHDSSPVFSFVDDDIHPDICGINTSTSAYDCLAGTGSGFGSTIISLTNTVDYRSVYGSTCSGYFCAPGVIESEDKINMPAPQWVDIDGDLDNDLCWLSAKDAGLKCVYKSIDPTTHAMTLSAAQLIYSLNYPTASAGMNEGEFNEVKAGVNRFVASFRIPDLNADSLPDICYANGHQFNCSINKGGSFAPATQWIDVSSTFPDVEDDGDLRSLVTIRTDDMNLDGLPDFCLIKNEQQLCGYNQIGSFGELKVRQSIAADMDSNVNSVNIYENFVRKVVDKLGFGNWKTLYVTGDANLAYGNIVNVPDINGDGYPEFCYRSIHGILCTSNDNYGASALLIGITDSFGQTTTIEYGNLISDGLYEPANQIPSGYYEQPTNAFVVDTVTVNTGVVEGNWPYSTPISNSQSYKYKGFLRNPVTGVAGYSAMTVKQNERNVSTTMHFSLEEHLVGRELFIEEFIGDTLLKTKQNQFSIVNESHGRHRIRLEQVEEKQFDLDGALVSTNTTNSANFDSYGFPQQATATKVMAEDGETLTTVTETQYLHDTTNWLLAKPELQTVDHHYQGNSVTRVVSYTYTNGLMTQEVIQPGASNASTIEYTYDSAGNTNTVTTSGSGQQRTITKAFDDMGRVTSLTNELGQSEQFVYHNYCPGVTSHTDVAGKVTTTTYDFACRQIHIDSPDDNATSFVYEWATADDNSLVNQPIDHPYNYRNPIVYKVTETHADGTWSSAWFDAQARTIRAESVGFSTENFARAVVKDTVYDRFGRTTATTLPYYKINGEYITPSWITFNFDAASRVASENKIGPDGSPLTTYYQYDKSTFTLSYSDYSKTTQTGVFGEPLSIDENGLTVEYSYDPLGNLISTHQNGVVTAVSYDSRGFKSSQTDSAMGTWTYQHNAFGELVAQTDAKNQTTTFVYDQLGRLIEKTEPEGQTIWTYNASGNGIGQLHQEQGVNATKQWAYDSLGRAISETLTVDGQQFVTQFAYDGYSRLQKTTQPNGLEVHNSFDSTGAVNAVSIPANQVRGFDAEKLQTEYEAVLQLLIDIENQIESLKQQRNYHLAKSLEYQTEALRYAGLLDEVNNQIATLTALAEEHEDIAARYEQAANDLRAQSDAYRAQFGNRAFTFINQSNGKYNFSATWCADRHKFWGGCKRRETHYVSISTANLNTVNPNDSVYFYEERTVPVCRKVNQEVHTGRGEYYTAEALDCSGTQQVQGPICNWQERRLGREGEYGSELVNVCDSLIPHMIYSKAASDFEKLRDVAAAKAQSYRDQIEQDGASHLAPTVLVRVPTGNTIVKTQWIPIAGDIVTFIPTTIQEVEMVDTWETLSLSEAVTYYQEKVDYYTNLALDELASYNNLSQQLQDLAGDFDDLDAAQYYFAQLLYSAGLLVGDDKGVAELLQDAIARQNQWEGSNQPLMVWSATMRAANGLLESELFGNGLYTHRTIHHDTGLITSIKTGAYSTQEPLRQLDYTFDSRGMIIGRSDTSNSSNITQEVYDYDTQGRLRSWSFDQQLTDEANLTRNNQLWRTYEYDDRGNMTYKTGAGLAMHYNNANQLTSRDLTGGTTATYTYDANGNMLHGDGRNYQWNSFNKAETITTATHTVNFDYDASQRRVLKRSDLETIYYVNAGYEKVIKHRTDGTNEVIHRHNIWNGDDVVATFEKREVDADQTYMGDDVKYYHRDHLGNGELVTDASMDVLAQRFYTPYGELVEDALRREQPDASVQAVLALGIETEDYMLDVQNNNDSIGDDVHLLVEALNGGTVFVGDYRGFTSHENIKELGLVNMNARLYDPVIGRFVSADSVIPDLSHPLAYNRYAYVRNNPMSYRDPTGHWWEIALAVFAASQLTDSVVLQQVSALVLSAALAGQGGPFYAGSEPTRWAIVASAAKTSATVTFLQTGNVKASLEAGAWSGLSAGVANYVGHDLVIGDFDFSNPANWVAKSVMHGLTQGVISDLRGDKFATGFASGLIGSIAGHYSAGATFEARIAISMVSGYLSAEAVGGDGFQGALNAAVVFLYNHWYGRLALGKKGWVKGKDGRPWFVRSNISPERLLEMKKNYSIREGRLKKQVRTQLNNINELASKPGRSEIKATISRRWSDKLGKAFVGPGYKVSRGTKGELQYTSADGMKLYRAPTSKSSDYAKTGVQANFQQRFNRNTDWMDKQSVSNVHVHSQ